MARLRCWMISSAPYMQLFWACTFVLFEVFNWMMSNNQARDAVFGKRTTGDLWWMVMVPFKLFLHSSLWQWTGPFFAHRLFEFLEWII